MGLEQGTSLGHRSPTTARPAFRLVSKPVKSCQFWAGYRFISQPRVCLIVRGQPVRYVTHKNFRKIRHILFA